MCALHHTANEFSLMEPVGRHVFFLHYLLAHDTLSIPSPASLCEVIDGGKLNQSGEDEGVADSDEPVHGSGVRNFRQRVPRTDAQSCHCQNSGHT